MNLKSLEYFLEVSKDMNMTRTAQRLYISQQALSLQIQKLEQYYGTELLVRRPKLQLTYAGLQLLNSATTILRENELLVNRLADVSNNHHGTLRIGISAVRASEGLPHILPEFNKRWPNISIHLVENQSSTMLQMLSDGQLDLLVAPYESAMANERITSILLGNEQNYLVCSDPLLERCFGEKSSDVKLAAAQGTDLKEFSDIPFILHKHPMRLRKLADECFLNAGFKPKVYIESSNSDLIISLYPCHLGAFFCRDTRLPAIFSAFPDCNAFPITTTSSFVGTPIYLLYNKTQPLATHVADFIKLTTKAWEQMSQYGRLYSNGKWGFNHSPQNGATGYN